MKQVTWTRILLTSSLALLSSAGRGQELKPGQKLPRTGDEIVVCGQFYHTTAPVVLWMDPGGYDAYRLERRFAPPGEELKPNPKSPEKPLGNRFGQRRRGLSDAEQKLVRERGWDLETLRKSVDQFVLHFDARGTSRRCFEVLHDMRGLSVHFMLDLDGTIYQTLDLKEAAWHATVANGRSIGIEIANIGALPPNQAGKLDEWYRRDQEQDVRIVVPDPADRSGIRDQTVVLRPARAQPIEGVIQKQQLRQYDYTEPQYQSLVRLTATLCALFPSIRCDYPRDEQGELVRAKLTDTAYASYHGILGHFHVQTNRVDPGPAFQWDRLISEARARLSP